MKRSKHLISLLLSIGILLAASVINASSEEREFPLNITDSAGREVSIPEPVKGIIVLNTDAAEAVSALGASDLIVGLAEGILADYEFQSLKERPSIGTWNDLDFEKIGEIGSKVNGTGTIVLGYVYPGRPNGVEAVAKSLEPFDGIVALGLDFYKEENLSREMRLLGTILGREDRAEEIIDWHDQNVAEVEQAVADLDRPRVFIEGSSRGLGDITTFGGSSASGMLLEEAGGFNVMEEDEAYPKVEWEWVVSQDPEIIINTDYLKSSDGLPGWSLNSSSGVLALEEMRNEILSRPGARNISAVKNNRVYIVSAQSLFGLDSVAGLQRLAEVLHPGIALEPEKAYGEYLDFMGLEEQKDRLFVFPAVD